jgi:hypothetical protein
MKKLIATIAIIMIIALAGTANAWTINGVPSEKFKVSPVKAVAGVVASALVHTAGHYVMAAAFGKSMHQNPDNIFEEVWEGSYSRSQEAWVGRAGFLAQLGTGFVLNKLDIGHDFMLGFNAMSLVEISSYPFVHENIKRNRYYSLGAGDLGSIDASGQSGLEVMGYTLIAIYNLND